jgi:O-antigen/teichoic acid export membrane protein
MPESDRPSAFPEEAVDRLSLDPATRISLDQMPLEEAGGGDRPSVEAHATVRREGALALRNALKLAFSLIATWSVALVVTFKLPRYLGTSLNGDYQWSLATAATVFVFIDLGVDTYIQREVPVRPEHASDFFLGFALARIALAVPLFGVASLLVMHRPGHVQIATLLFGVTQVFMAFNTTFSKMLQAATKVGSLAIVNVVAKLLWGGGTFFAVMVKAPFVMLVLPMLLSEGMKAAFLFYVTRNAVQLKLDWHLSRTKAVLKESFPFFVSAVAVTLGGQLDVTMLGFLVASDEVGLYGAARQIANLSMLLSPIMSGVLIPMMRRARERSEEEFFSILRRVLEGVVVVALPITLLLALGSDVAVHYALKDAFLPASGSLRFLAPTMVFAYGNVLLWLSLMIMGRSWTITIVSLVGLACLPLFIFIAVPMTKGLGVGGPGTGTAIALSLRELGVVLTFLAFLGSRALDRRNVGAILKSFAICVAVSMFHVGTAKYFVSWPMQIARVFCDGVLYLVLMLATGVLRVSDAIAVAKLIKRRGR